MVVCLTTLYGNDRINRICHRCGRFLLYNCGCDGIGRHARFRFLCREACRFKSCHPHQTPGTKVPGVFADGDLESWDSRSPLPLRSVPVRRPPDVWHPVIRITDFKSFIYKGLEFFWYWICSRRRVFVGNYQEQNDQVRTGRGYDRDWGDSKRCRLEKNDNLTGQITR